MNNTISEQINELADKYHFLPELVNRLCFIYGYKRAKSLIESLKTHTKNYAIRVNTLLTTPEELEANLNEKDISAHIHPEVKDAVLINVEGPYDLQSKEKSIIVHNTTADKVLTGANVGSSGIKSHEDLKIGDEISIKDKFETIVGNGIVMMNSNEISSQKRGTAVRVTHSKYKLPNFQNLKEYLRGHFIAQELPSIMITSQISLKQQDRVLDMTVGEGIMLTHVWQNNSDKNARIIAIDNSNVKLQKLQENLKRLRMMKAPIESMNLNAKKMEKKFSRDETFDVILVDPPCSEIGLRPKVSDSTNEKSIIKASYSHKKFMSQAARLIKPNGTIVYTTRSIDPEENENVIEYAVDELKLTVVDQKIFLGDKCAASFKGAEKIQCFYPDIHDTSGYFVAKLTK